MYISVNGSWSPWLEWSSCSLSCGIGTQQRQRQCDNPQPSYGGMNCSGDEIEAMNCDLKPCAGQITSYLMDTVSEYILETERRLYNWSFRCKNIYEK